MSYNNRNLLVSCFSIITLSSCTFSPVAREIAEYDQHLYPDVLEVSKMHNSTAIELMGCSPGQITSSAELMRCHIHDMARQLIKFYNPDKSKEKNIYVNLFTNLAMPHHTSAFGLYVSEQLNGEMQRLGFNVLSDKRPAYPKEVKENAYHMIMPDEVWHVSRLSQLNYAIEGTYIVRDGQILINARLLDAENGYIISSSTTTFASDNFFNQMLKPHIPLVEPPSVKLAITGEKGGKK